MRETKVVITAVLISLFLLASMSVVVFASLENWVEVVRFNGTIWPEYTEHFTIDYFDWRINWSYTPRLSETINPYIFRLNVKNASDYIIEFLFASNQISGTLNMNQTGEYYLYIDPMHAENYSITIVQNIDSIPEFPSWFILPLFLVSVLVAIVIRNKIAKQRRNENFFSKE